MNRALQWKLIAGFLLVFLAGGVTGAFVGAAHARHFFFMAPRPAVISERMRERLQRELSLTPEQVAKISRKLEQIEDRHRRWHHGHVPHESPPEQSPTP